MSSQKTTDADVSRQVAEESRELDWKKPSFSGQLFMGYFDASGILPYDELKGHEKKEVEAFCDKLEEYLLKNYDADEIDRKGKIPDKIINDLKKMGLFNLKLPKEYGGLGFSQQGFARVAEVVTSHCGSLSAWVSAHQSIGVPQPLKHFGTKEQKDKYFPKLVNGAISAFALTEPTVGSDPARMKTYAEPSEDGKHYYITGEKLWCTNGSVADLLVVMAGTTDPSTGKKGITAFIVEVPSDGLEVAHRCDFMGLKAIENALITFDKVKVPRENILGGINKGLKLALETLNTGRLTVPASMTAASKVALRIVREWSKERAQWGQTIGKHEAVSAKISYIAAHTFAIDAMTYLTSRLADQENVDIRIEAAMAKMFTTEHGWTILDHMVQVRGGRGYETAESLKARGEKPIPAERMVRDLRINRILEGSTEIMHLFLAREALDTHLKKGGDLLNPKLDLGQKIIGAMKAGAFYVPWYLTRYSPFVTNKSFSEEPAALHPYYRYVARVSRKLARTIFHKMGRHMAALEYKQRTLARIVDIGTDLFSITACAAKAGYMIREGHSKVEVMNLMNAYFTFAKTRIDRNFDELWKAYDKEQKMLTKDVLDDRLLWLEKGIINPKWEGEVVNDKVTRGVISVKSQAGSDGEAKQNGSTEKAETNE